MLHNGQMVPLAYLVCNGAELVVRPVFLGISAVLVCLKCLSIPHTHIIEYTMYVYVAFVGMDCEIILILVLEILLA